MSFSLIIQLYLLNKIFPNKFTDICIPFIIYKTISILCETIIYNNRIQPSRQQQHQQIDNDDIRSDTTEIIH
jgi:hypothetical protein